MNSKVYVRVLLASFLLGIGISFVGCGSSGAPGVALPPASGVVAQVVSGETPSNCYWGRVTQAVDGTQVCQSTITSSGGFSYTYLGAMARLSPSTSTGQYAGITNIQVQPNDKLTIASVSGGWGSVSSGWITTGKCKSVDPAGHDSANGGTVLMNEGLPSGLFLSTGSAIYPAFGSSVVYFNEGGIIRYGFNVPLSSGTCHSVSLSYKLERCLDVAGLPHKCQ